MRVAIVCYASLGGSGAVAVELGKCLARDGHEIHVVSSEPPFRLPSFHPSIRFHEVDTPGYPLFREPQYLLALANRLVHVSRAHSLDIIHAHYAIPHSAAAYLAKQILTSQGGGNRPPKVVTTLHGTDISIVGSDPSYSEIAAFCIERSDGVTAVSESLRRETTERLRVEKAIRVIPNFLDCGFYGRRFDESLRERFCPTGTCEKLIVHASNFRPVKRVETVVEVFRRVCLRVRARLLLVGQGPELNRAVQLAEELGLGGRVEATGEQRDVIPLLSISDVFLLPSATESFGLAALEAMACGVPVVASDVGGLPEVVERGITGFLHPPEDVDGMAASVIRILEDDQLRARMSADGRRLSSERFSADRVVPLYENLYREVLEHN
jgi:L-malate glycosyltransferase